MNDKKSQDRYTLGTGNTISVLNQGEASFTYKNTAIHVNASARSNGSVAGVVEDCDISSQAKQSQPSAVGIYNQGTMTINNPVINSRTTEVETEEEQLQRILRTIHKNTWEKTHFNIRDNFKADKFPEPDFQVHPQMVESPYFYQGGHQAIEDEGDEEDSESDAMVPGIKRPEYNIDNKFLYYEDGDDPTPEALSVESMMRKILTESEKYGILGILAQAGAGKTTCLRRWARKVMEGSGLTPDNNFKPSKESRFKMVHFIEMKSIGYSDKTTLEEILFGEFFRSAEDPKKTYDWLCENQKKAIIFLDGLDQARWAIEEEDCDYIGPYESSTTTKVFANLLIRNRLPGVRIILSSREHTATRLPEDAWFDEVVTLTGFTEDDAKKLFNAITISTTPAEKKIPSKRAYQDSAFHTHQTLSNWDILASTSTALVPFVSVPAFLMFTAIVFNTYRTAPTSITDLMAKVVGTLQYSLVIKEKKQIWNVINKLKQLSHIGMEDGLVIFSKDLLKKFQLEAKDIRDLVIMVPRSRSLSHRLVEGDCVFFFCHQIIQEFLSACAIVEMSLEDFEKFVETKLNKDRWSVVRRFVCGLVFTSSRRYEQLLTVSDREERKRILHDSLAGQLKVEENWKWFELYAAIYESKDEVMLKLIKRIDMYLPTINAIHLVSAIMAKNKQYEAVNCNEFSDEMLNLMIKNLGNVKVKAGSIQLKTNTKFTSATLNKFLGRVTSDDVQIRHGYTTVDSAGLDLFNISQLKIEIYWSNMGIIIHKDNSDDVKLIFYDDDKGIPPIHFGDFNMKRKQLQIDAISPDWSFLVYCAEVASYYLKPQSKIFNVKGQAATQYVFHGYVDSILSWQSDAKIERVVLVYVYHKHDEDVDEYDIGHQLCHCKDKLSSFVQQLQVRVMDIAVLPRDVEHVPASLRHELRQLGCEMKINIVEVVGSDSGLPKLSSKLRGHEIDTLRLMTWFKVSNEALKSFIKSVAASEQLWIYSLSSEDEDDVMYSASEKRELEEIATSCGNILKFQDGKERDDPWSAILMLI